MDSLLKLGCFAPVQNDLCIGLEVGGAVDVQGALAANRVLVANSIQRAKDSPDSWPADI